MPHCEVEAQEHEALQRNHHARRDARVPGGSRSRRHGKQVTKAKRGDSETDRELFQTTTSLVPAPTAD